MSQLLETRFGTHVYVALFSMVDIAKSNSCNPNHRICEHVRSQDLHHKVIQLTITPSDAERRCCARWRRRRATACSGRRGA
jgi:hypothetical protein